MSGPDTDTAYHSCEYIQGGVVFYPTKLHACCVIHKGAVGQPVIAEYRGGPFPFEEVAEWRRNTIEQHKKGKIIPDCRGCPVLTKQKWGAQEQYPISMITIAHYSHCNLRCNYCYTVLAPHLNIKAKKVYDLLSIFKELIETKQLSPRAEIRFSGGEPSVLPEFEELLTMVSEYGPRIRIYTNAVVRSEAILRALAKQRVELVLGIDAATDEVYKIIKGRNVNQQVWENVATYVALDAEHCFPKIIFRAENVGDAKAFVERCESIGAKKIYYDLDANIGASGTTADDSIIDALATVKYECEKRGIQAFSAEVGANSLSVDSVAARVEKRYDEFVARDTSDGTRMRALRELQKDGVDWQLYQQGMSQFGVDFAAAVAALPAVGSASLHA